MLKQALKEKLEIIELHEKGASFAKISREKDINESELFIRENRKQRIEAASLLEQLTPSADLSDPDDSISVAAAGSASSQFSSKPHSLPKINLPTHTVAHSWNG